MISPALAAIPVAAVQAVAPAAAVATTLADPNKPVPGASKPVRVYWFLSGR